MINQPPNTPLNADDELRDRVQDICDRIGAGLLPPTGAGAIMQLILADRKKHELQARLSEATAAWGASCDMPSAGAISRSLARRKDYLEQELEKL